MVPTPAGSSGRTRGVSRAPWGRGQRGIGGGPRGPPGLPLCPPRQGPATWSPRASSIDLLSSVVSTRIYKCPSAVTSYVRRAPWAPTRPRTWGGTGRTCAQVLGA